MTYRVWEGINKHESHWAVRKRRRMTPRSVHKEKGGGGVGGVIRKGEEDHRRGITSLTVRGRKKHGNATGPDQSLQTLHSS